MKRTGVDFRLSRGCAFLFSCLMLISVATASEPVELDIPAQPLSSAVQALAAQARISVLYTEGLVGGKHSAGLKGRYLARDALRELLRGSGLAFRFTDAETVVIHDGAQDLPLRDAGEPRYRSSSAGESAALETIRVVSGPIIEETRVDDFSAVSSLVTERQLRDQNAVDLASALRRTPGVQISRFNPVGAFGGREGGGVFIRGMGASRPGGEIKTYIDNVPFYIAVWNHPLLDLLPVNGMGSISVFKGPQPHISGNNFASINLETKRASEDGLQGNARISAGSFGTFIQQLDVTGKSGNVDYMLAQGYARSDGHRDDAEGELKNVMGRIGKQLNPSWHIGASFLYTDNEAKDPGDNRLPAPAVAQEFNTQAGMASASLSHRHGDWSGDLRIFHNRGAVDWLDQPAPEGDTITDFEMSGVRWKEVLSPWRRGVLTAGIDIDWMSGEVDFDRIAPAPRQRLEAPTFRIVSPYVALSHDFDLGRWTLTPSAGVRYYDHSDFDAAATPHAGVSLSSGPLTLFANASRGINYPGLDVVALAAQIPALGLSWRELEAEKLNHLEVGAQLFVGDATRIDVSLFRDELKNRYVFGFPPDVPPPPRFLNLGDYVTRGAELAVTHSFREHWSLFAAVTLMDQSIDDLPYSPKEAATAGVNGHIGPVSIAIDAQYQAKTLVMSRLRNVASTNTEEVGSFAVVNARVSHPVPVLGSAGEVFLAVENLFDRDYGYRPGYPMPGIGAQLGVSASF